MDIVAKAESEPEAITITEKGLFDVSAKKNVVCFVLDMTDTADAEKAFADNPAMLDGLDGFTWYQNSVGSMIPTRYGIPSLLTGVRPKPGEDAADFLANMYTSSYFLDDVAAQGYTTGVYSDTAGLDPTAGMAIWDSASRTSSQPPRLRSRPSIGRAR